ncbi:MAG: RNA-binding protein [Lentimicrobiaceae bacterium]|jgi:RNA recognition motif-containing protein|nr:RNA-binding protein [Lentimicrobiaceae bacterium]
MNIYISGLSYAANDADLKNLFAEYGEISSARVIIDKFSGNSRGFGFVEMPNQEEALKAIEGLHDTTHDGKVISVSEARPREERPRYNNRNGGNSRRY